MTRVTTVGRTGPGPLPAAFYLPAGDGVFQATRATESPWDPEAQHGGPACALLAHAMRSASPRPDFRLARLTVEFLGVIPKSAVHVSARVVRPGRRVRLLEAELRANGRAVALARAWEIAPLPLQLPEALAADEGLAPPLHPPQPQGFFQQLATGGYGEAIEWRWARGAYDEPGSATVWTRTRIPLVAGEPSHGVDRVLIVADSANGVSAVLSPDEYLFVPPAVTVTLHRHPRDEWVRLRASTAVVGDGLGSTLATLSDQSGAIGSVTQPLLIAARR